MIDIETGIRLYSVYSLLQTVWFVPILYGLWKTLNGYSKDATFTPWEIVTIEMLHIFYFIAVAPYVYTITFSTIPMFSLSIATNVVLKYMKAIERIRAQL